MWRPGEFSPLVVERSGRILILVDGLLKDGLTGDVALPDALQTFGLTGPFHLYGQHGPDLIAPRPHLRIVPGKVSGEPHVAGTRITSLALSSLANEGYPADQIASMYDLEIDEVREASALEASLGSFPVAA